MATANMQSIFDRLNGVASYHPLSAETFGDWAMEAGDIVKVIRGDEEYNVPIHTSTLVWRGQQRMNIDSTGKKERDSIAKASADKYRRGGAGVRAQQGLHKELEDETGSLRSALDYTAESLRVTFENEINSTRSEFRITSESLRIAFENELSSTRSEFQMTSESLRVQFENELSSTRSEFQMTSESLRVQFENELSSTRSEFQMTSESLRVEFESDISSTRAEIQVQANRIGLVVSGTGANAKIRPAQIVAAINDSESTVVIDADKVAIGGSVKINDVFSVESGYVYTKVSIYAKPGAVFNGDHVGSFYYSQQEEGHSVQYGVLKKAAVEGNALKIWKFGDAEGSPSITFSKATTLTGAVGSGDDGNKYIVTASPQGVEHKVTISTEIEGSPNPNATVYAKSYATSASITKTQIGSAVEMTLEENVSDKYVEIYTGSGSSKIQKGKVSTSDTYDAGYGSARLSASWGTGNDANKLTISKAKTGSTASLNYYITTDTAVVWDSTESKFKATPHAYCDGAERKTGTTVYSGAISIQFNNLQGSGASAYRTVSIKNGSTVIKTSGNLTDYGDGYSAGNSAGITTGRSDAGVTYNASNHTVSRALSSSTKSYTIEMYTGNQWSNGTRVISARIGSTDINSTTIYAPSATLSFDCTDQGDPSTDENDHTITATAKHGTYSLGSGTQVIHMTQGSWSNGKKAVNCRLTNDSGKLVDRLWVSIAKSNITGSRGNRQTSQPSYDTKLTDISQTGWYVITITCCGLTKTFGLHVT